MLHRGHDLRNLRAVGNDPRNSSTTSSVDRSKGDAETSRPLSKAQLEQKVRSLRRLPPGTKLPLLPREEERQLFRAILQFSESEDLFGWLERTHGVLTARLALQYMLEQFGERARIYRRRSERRQRLPDVEQLLLGELLRQPAGLEPFAQLERGNLASTEVLSDIIRRLRRLRGDSSTIAASQVALGWRDRLLLEGLELPDSIDIVEWLRTARGHESALVTMYNLTNDAIPRTNFAKDSLGVRVQARRPGQVIRRDGIVQVSVEEVAFGSSGFSVLVRSRLSKQALLGAEDSPIQLAWTGFDYAADDIGNRYVLQGFYSTGLEEQRMAMAFFPALSLNAREVTVASRPAIVQLIGIRSGLSSLDLPYLDIGDIIWRASVPDILTLPRTAPRVVIPQDYPDYRGQAGRDISSAHRVAKGLIARRGPEEGSLGAAILVIMTAAAHHVMENGEGISASEIHFVEEELRDLFCNRGPTEILALLEHSAAWHLLPQQILDAFPGSRMEVLFAAIRTYFDCSPDLPPRAGSSNF